MNEKIYMDMMEAADCLETLGKLSQVFFSEVKPLSLIHISEPTRRS